MEVRTDPSQRALWDTLHEMRVPVRKECSREGDPFEVYSLRVTAIDDGRDVVRSCLVGDSHSLEGVRSRGEEEWAGKGPPYSFWGLSDVNLGADKEASASACCPPRYTSRWTAYTSNIYKSNIYQRC